MADFSAWEAYKEITVQDANVDGNLTDFPCLVVLDADSDVGGRSQSAGQDLRFTLSDGTTQLKHEVENFAIATGDASGNIWVKVPSIAASGGASIRMYYGNDGASDGQDVANTWSSSYEGVWHCNEASGTTVGDSSSNGFDGTMTNMAAEDWVPGKISTALDFPDATDYVTMGNQDELRFIGQDFSGSCWIKQTRTTDTVRQLMGPSHKMSWGLLTFTDGTGSLWFYAANSYVQGTASTIPNADEWYHVGFAFEYSGSNNNDATLYVNGQAAGTASSLNDVGVTAYEFVLGIDPRDHSGYAWDGEMDEVRLASTLRNADWFKFEHANINEADNELTWGSEVANAADIPLYYYAQEQAAAL